MAISNVKYYKESIYSNVSRSRLAIKKTWNEFIVLTIKVNEQYQITIIF